VSARQYPELLLLRLHARTHQQVTSYNTLERDRAAYSRHYSEAYPACVFPFSRSPVYGSSRDISCSQSCFSLASLYLAEISIKSTRGVRERVWPKFARTSHIQTLGHTPGWRGASNINTLLHKTTTAIHAIATAVCMWNAR